MNDRRVPRIVIQAVKELSILKIAAILCVILAATDLSPARADEAATREEISKAAAALDQAFAQHNREAAKELMTPEHLAITPYYKGPQNITDQLNSLSKLDYEQTILGESVPVVLLGPEVALRMFAAELKGNFEGQKLPAMVYVSEVWVKRDRWRQKLYQATTLRP